MEAAERIAKLDHVVDHVWPTLVTKSDLREALNDAKADLCQALRAQTCKIIGAALAASGPIVTSVKLLH